MRRYSPPYHSPPRRGYGGRPRSPPRRGYGGHGSLLVRNIPLDCRPEELRVPFERFGLVRDVYLPKDYYTGEISVVVAAETRKRPEDMRRKSRLGRGPAGYGARRPPYHGYSRSRSRSRSPRYPSGSRSRHRSRSFSPAPRGRSDYSISPDRRYLDHPRYSRDHLQDQHLAHNRRSYSPGYVNMADQNVNSFGKRTERESGEALGHWRSPPGRASRSPSGSRSRSADISPRHGR